jgi:hypothetical protein
MHRRRRIQYDALSPFLVRKCTGDGFLEEVRKRAVTQIVKECGRERFPAAIERDALGFRQRVLQCAKTLEKQLHDERGPKRMRKSRVLRPGKSHGRHAELPDPPQSLNFRCRQ